MEYYFDNNFNGFISNSFKITSGVPHRSKLGIRLNWIRTWCYVMTYSKVRTSLSTSLIKHLLIQVLELLHQVTSTSITTCDSMLSTSFEVCFNRFFIINDAHFIASIQINLQIVMYLNTAKNSYHQKTLLLNQFNIKFKFQVKLIKNTCRWRNSHKINSLRIQTVSDLWHIFTQIFSYKI